MQKSFMPLVAVLSVSFALFLILAVGLSNAQTFPHSEMATFNRPNANENAAIYQLLDNYTHSVSTGDQALFESQLLDLSIPFSWVDEKKGGVEKMDYKRIQDYPGFRKSIFESHKKFKQRFSNIKIEQLGNLAQVSLDYETTLAGHEFHGKGWKVLQLINVQGQWKIASELFTGY